MAQPTPHPPPPEQLLMQMATGKWVSKAFGVVADLAIPDLLGAGPRPVDELAKNSGVNADALDQVVSDRPEAAFSKLIDLEMPVMTPGGRERTEPEFARLLESAGLKMTRIVATESVVSIVEAVAR